MANYRDEFKASVWEPQYSASPLEMDKCSMKIIYQECKHFLGLDCSWCPGDASGMLVLLKVQRCWVPCLVEQKEEKYWRKGQTATETLQMSSAFSRSKNVS